MYRHNFLSMSGDSLKATMTYLCCKNYCFFNMLKALLKKVDCVSNFADPPALRHH